ncbi:MAG: peptidase domain-containing ABC transporter [Burkholderiales bacterium]|nr:peptidase domain-containing ABC transporter [Burkholderiales bacterium]
MQPILQTQTTECGLACLAMVANALGQRVGLSDLRRRFPQSLKGATLKQLIVQGDALGLLPRPLKLGLDELPALQTPCILHWNLNHFVVLERTHRGGGITIVDPALGRRRVGREETSRCFTGVALELTARADFKQAVETPRLRLGRLSGRIRGLAVALAQIAVVALVLEAFAIGAPLLTQWVVDEAIVAQDAELLDVLVLGFGLLLLCQVSLGMLRSWLVVLLGRQFALAWLSNVFRHLLRLPVAYFEHRHLGDVVSRFDAVKEIQRTMTTSSVEALLDGLMAGAALAMMIWYAPALAAVVGVAAAVYALLRGALYHPLRETQAEHLVAEARERSHFMETLRAVQALKLFGREAERCAHWQGLAVGAHERKVRMAQLRIGWQAAQAAIFGIENLLVLWLGARLVMGLSGAQTPQTGGEPALTVGMLLAFLAYKIQFSGRIARLVDYLVELRMLRLHAERLADIVLEQPEQAEADGHAAEHDLSHLPASLTLRGVSFRYGEGEPWVIRQADLHIDAGEHVAIAGASGSGKTTLLKLALGLLEPTEGEVLYGGLPLRRLGLANVRRRIGTVMQDDVLLTGSLADNITFFDAQPDAARVERAARLAMLHEDIVRMPMGYHSLVGDLGSGLSGGQRQRLLLARALYRGPAVLALDEATSHLDVGNERAITQLLAQLAITRVVIAHRPDTIASAQRVVHLRDGQVHEAARAARVRGA